MNNRGYYIAQTCMIAILAMLTMTAAGCDVIGGIFKAGFWTAVVLLVVLIGGVLLLVRMFKK